MALWARAFEKICKLAMIYSVSTDVNQPLIDTKAVNWAWRLVKYLNKRMLYQASNHVYENVFDEKCKKIIRYIKQAGGQISHSKLLYKSHESGESLKQIIETLKESQQIEQSYDHSGRKTAKIYRLLDQ